MYIDPRFELYVDIQLSEDELQQLVLSQLDGSEQERGYVLKGPNVIAFEENTCHDPSRCDDGEDAWEYYRQQCYAFPIRPTDIAAQQKLALELQRIFQASGAKTWFAAEFELPEDE